MYLCIYVYHNFITLPLYKKDGSCCLAESLRPRFVWHWAGQGLATRVVTAENRGAKGWKVLRLQTSKREFSVVGLQGSRSGLSTSRFEMELSVWVCSISWVVELMYSEPLKNNVLQSVKVAQNMTYSICSCPFLFRRLTRAMYFGRCQAFTLGWDSSWSSGRAQLIQNKCRMFLRSEKDIAHYFKKCRFFLEFQVSNFARCRN